MASQVPQALRVLHAPQAPQAPQAPRPLQQELVSRVLKGEPLAEQAQASSLFFKMLPGEIRNMIYKESFAGSRIQLRAAYTLARPVIRGSSANFIVTGHWESLLTSHQFFNEAVYIYLKTTVWCVQPDGVATSQAQLRHFLDAVSASSKLAMRHIRNVYFERNPSLHVDHHDVRRIKKDESSDENNFPNLRTVSFAADRDRLQPRYRGNGNKRLQFSLQSQKKFLLKNQIPRVFLDDAFGNNKALVLRMDIPTEIHYFHVIPFTTERPRASAAQYKASILLIEISGCPIIPNNRCIT